MTFDFNMLGLFAEDINMDNLNVTLMVKVDWSEKKWAHQTKPRKFKTRLVMLF